MAEGQSSLDLIVYKLDRLDEKIDDIKHDNMERFKNYDDRLEKQAVRIRLLEDESLRLKTTLLPLGMVFSAALGVGVKLAIDAIAR
jgi:hypothetical protein